MQRSHLKCYCFLFFFKYHNNEMCGSFSLKHMIRFMYIPLYITLFLSYPCIPKCTAWISVSVWDFW